MNHLRILLLLTLACPSIAVADGAADEAELHFQLAAERYLAKDYRGALEHFLTSNRLVPNRNVGFNIARTYEQLGRFADAHRYYAEAKTGETNTEIVAQIEQAMQRIAPNVAVVDVRTSPPGATIYVDRRDLGSRGTSPLLLAFPAGKVRIMASLAGHEEPTPTEVEVALGQVATVTLTLAPIVGTLEIDAEPGTDAQVGDAKCKSPCTLPLPPGPYTVTLSREGREPLTQQVVVSAKETVTVRAALRPLVGSVVVSTDEPGALVEIDGNAAGFTPVVVPNVSVGARKVRVSLRGFAPIERDVTVGANEKVELLELPLEPIREVTAASRFAEPIDDAPSSVTMISSQELRAFGYPTIAESLRGVRGISVSNDSIYSSVNIRGIGLPNDYGNRLLVLADGMIMNDNISASSYIGYDGRVHLEDVERIEVVRGAGSVLYGTGAISGVVNVVTRELPTESHAFASLGTVENAIARLSAGFQLSLGEDAGLWTSVGLARSDGRVIYAGAVVDTRTGTIAGVVDAFDAGSVSGRAWYGPLTLQWHYVTREIRSGLGAYGTDFGDPTSSYADTRGMLELRFEPELSDSLQLLLRAHANATRFTGEYDYEDEISAEVYDGSWLGAEARLVLTPLDERRRLRLTVGGTVEGHLRAAMVGGAEDGSDRYLDEDHPYVLGAVYALAEGAIIDEVRYSAGARLDFFSTFGASFSPRLALIVKPWDGGVFKLLAGRAFRAPSVYELYYNDGGRTQVASPELSPETSHSLELEYSHRFLEDWVALGAIHATLLDGTIETRGEGSEDDPLVYANVDKQAITLGADVELRREWRRGWMFSVAYGYQRAQFTEIPDGFVDARVINAPEHIGSIRGAAPIVPGLATLAARVGVEGPRRIDAADLEETDPSVVADVVLSGESERYHLRYSVGVYNLFDNRYEVPLTFGSPLGTLPQSGRTLLLELELAL